MISLQRAKRLMKEEGAHKVSKKAAVKLNEILEKKAREVIRRDVRNASFYGRSTIKEEDFHE